MYREPEDVERRTSGDDIEARDSEVCGAPATSAKEENKVARQWKVTGRRVGQTECAQCTGSSEGNPQAFR